MVAVVKFGVTKGEPVCKKVVLFEPYHATVLDTQVADNEAVALLQMLGFAVPVGEEGVLFIVTDVVALAVQPKLFV